MYLARRRPLPLCTWTESRLENTLMTVARSPQSSPHLYDSRLAVGYAVLEVWALRVDTCVVAIFSMSHAFAMVAIDEQRLCTSLTMQSLNV